MVRIRICPKCKNATLKSAVNISGWLAPRMYECKSCGYIGSLFIEIDPEDFKEINNSSEVDTDTK
ncbi:MAG: transposase [Candidatus Lokiarchaeota archaeon]|nr:transposase [Candidatus Lokiarchaeota archaeon]